MAAKWLEALTGSLDEKKQYRHAMARLDALPQPYRAAAAANHRYLLHVGGITDGTTMVTMFGDLADLWERAATDGTPVRAITGEDPVEFIESFLDAYRGKRWVDTERDRLRAAIARLDGSDPA